MPTYSICKSFVRRGEISEKSGAVMRMFGLTTSQLSEKDVCHSCTVRISAGDVVYITGPSGAGKSVILRELEKLIGAEERINLSQIELCSDKSLIDCIEGDVLNGLKLLSVAGLNDCFSILNQPANLSDGQKWRFRLAMAMSRGKRFIFADEFCSELDRITAAVIAYNVRRFAKRNGVTFILAGSQEDVLIDLSPDVLVVKELSGAAEVIYKQERA